MRYTELLKQISLRYECECNRLLSEYDLTLAQVELQHFLFLRQEQGVPVNQRSIEEMLHLKNPTVTGILNRLESKGFIVRVADPRDRRVNIIMLTDKAVALRGEVVRAAEKTESMLTEGFSEEEKAQLQYLLGKMYANIRTYIGEQDCGR